MGHEADDSINFCRLGTRHVGDMQDLVSDTWNTRAESRQKKYSLLHAASPIYVLFVVVLASMAATLTRTEPVPRFSDPDQIPDRWQIAGPDSCSRPGLAVRDSQECGCKNTCRRAAAVSISQVSLHNRKGWLASRFSHSQIQDFSRSRLVLTSARHFSEQAATSASC